MNIEALDKALAELEKKKSSLDALDYNDPQYDDVEEQLHDMEDSFQDSFGADLEKVIQEVHDKHCPESDVLLPIAYMGDGVIVDSEEHPGKEVRLLLQSGPPRLVLKTVKGDQEVWNGK